MGYFGPSMMFADLTCSPSCVCAGVHGTVSICPPDCFQYKGTLDVFNKIIRQEGFLRLWRGTNAGLALAVPTGRRDKRTIYRCWSSRLNQQHELIQKLLQQLNPLSQHLGLSFPVC